MKFTHYKLGHVAGGTVVEVTLKESAANVRLMDQSNFNNFKAGRQHRYQGGLVTKSPVRLQVPRSGTWHVTVDMQGLRGSARSSISVIPAAALKPLPPVNEAWRCCTNRNWPARCQSTRSSPADAIRHWSAEGGHPIEDLTAEDGLTPLPSWTPGAQAMALLHEYPVGVGSRVVGRLWP